MGFLKLIWGEFFQTNRYFMVYYIASHPNGKLTGQMTLKVTGYKPFLNNKQTVNLFKDSNPLASDFVLTGFNELKKFEYERWNNDES